MAVITELIEYEDGGQTLEGYFARPEAASLGAVLVCHAWGGQMPAPRAAMKRKTKQ